MELVAKDITVRSAEAVVSFSDGIEINEFEDVTAGVRWRMARRGELDRWWDAFWRECHMIRQGVQTT